MILGFEFFDPKSGKCPETFPEYGQDIVFRARELLKHRSSDEIKSTIKLINWMIENSPARVESQNRLMKMVESPNSDDYENIITNDIDTSTYALKAYQRDLTIPEFDGMAETRWDEIFSITALALIDKAIDDEIFYGGWAHNEDFDWLYEWRILSHSSYWLIEAMDSIATAEGFNKSDLQETDAKKKISSRNTNAAIQRHAKTNDAVIAFKNFSLNGKYKSVRNAAQIFCEKFPDKVSHLAPYNRVRTICDAFAKLQKGQRRSIPNS